ncbi:hypothetical protein [Actinacidiphila sp. ITFR-21]|uniref:hypothetical protein n=1 Tax=Actinacidiphila sp. ITFR-21 TaxID=3075199 RepID=UPI00288B61C2|nr:hypothetical protein [Streptomyces sp. ITFR-21]WNI19226.1 hypothetical protein RLT57_29225 [Streptomyces sp. ITFR-21]
MTTFATSITRTRTSVELAFTDGPVITDEYGTPTQVTSLRITYVDGAPSAVAFDSEANPYFVQPGDLGKPEGWPGWLRDIVQQHRPADTDRLRTAYASARDRAAGTMEAAEWTRDDLLSDIAAIRQAVARYLGNREEGQAVNDLDLIAYLADAGIDLTVEITAHRAQLDA